MTSSKPEFTIEDVQLLGHTAAVKELLQQAESALTKAGVLMQQAASMAPNLSEKTGCRSVNDLIQTSKHEAKFASDLLVGVGAEILGRPRQVVQIQDLLNSEPPALT